MRLRPVKNTSQYGLIVFERAAVYGGFYNAHTHLDRADTLSDKYLEHIGTTPLKASNLPLAVKQNLVGDLHKGLAYRLEDLPRRMRKTLQRQKEFGTRRIDTNIDATPDLPEDGLMAINTALRLKREFKQKGLEVRIAPTPIFGFKKGTARWEVFAEAAKRCDYISALPEKDDYAKHADPDGRVGFKHHIRMAMNLGCELGREVQLHLDQMDIPGECGTERMLDMLEGLEMPFVRGAGTEPTVWIIHMISPSAYDELRFRRLVDRLLELNVGVIVCPTAALTMRQLRSISAPKHNSIARVGELIKAKVPLRVGTDNISDVFVPQGDGNMLTEVVVGDMAVRLNLPHIWAKLACGVPLNNVDINDVGTALYEDRKACGKINPEWEPAFE